MGYTTKFSGSFSLDKPLTPEQYGIIKLIEEQADLASLNIDLAGSPRSYLQWAVDADRKTIKWDGAEKFYNYVEWLEFLCVKLFTPWGYRLNGTVNFQGGDSTDRGRLVVKDNVVSKIKFATETEMYRVAKECCLQLLDNEPAKALEAAKQWRGMAML